MMLPCVSAAASPFGGSVAAFATGQRSGEIRPLGGWGGKVMRGRKTPFKGRQFTAEVILWAVRWYLMVPVSYCDLELMLAGRGAEVVHTTIFRRVQTYAPELG